MTQVPSRSPSGVRLEGDDYQHLVTLTEVLRAIRGDGYTTITVEASGAGNVDDIVLRSSTLPSRYTQVKHAVDAQTPVGTEWLLQPTRTGGRSLLQRFHSSWHLLGGPAVRPHLQLITDRDVDPDDPIVKMLDKRTRLLTPAVMAGNLDEARAVWATHLDIDDAELIALLSDLQIVTGRSMHDERETAELLLQALGYAHGQSAIDSGLALVREWVQERQRTIDVGSLARLIDERIGRATPPGALVAIEGIDDHPAAEQADLTLRFVDRYAGSDPFERRQLGRTADWTEVVWPALQSAAQHLRDTGQTRVTVAGAMRLPMWFGTGCAFREVLGFNVTTIQRHQLWSSDNVGPSTEVIQTVRKIGTGTDLAVVISIAASANADVAEYTAALDVGRLLTIEPQGGARPDSIPDGATAASLAVGARDAIRNALDASTEEIHLFLAAPAGFALLLGHRWNALRPTTIYEHLGAGRGYAPTLRVPA